MEVKTLIIGKNSNLSQHLLKAIDGSVAISARELLSSNQLLEPYKTKPINLIFNNFQTSTELDKLPAPLSYVNMAIVVTAKVLEFFIDANVLKVIYTSSSSVYGNNILCNEEDELRPLHLHAALKLSNEKLVAKYCIDNGINYTVARIFNMYGGDDHFSVISKIINACKNNLEMTIANHGNAIRDFMHIDDVVNIYSNLLRVENMPVVNVGSGEGQSIKSILDFLRHHNFDLKINHIERDEIKISTACNKRLLSTLGEMKFVNIEDYLKRVLSL